MGTIKQGDRVRINDGATGRVITVVNGSVYRVRYDHADPLGKDRGDYLAHVLRPYRGNSHGWR
jgi:hypothetical protein